MHDMPASERTAVVAPRGPGKGRGVGEGSGIPMMSVSDVLHAFLETSWANDRSSARFERFVTLEYSGIAAAGSGPGKA